MPASGAIQVSTRAGVAELRLDHSRHRNAISSTMWESLLHFAKTASTDLFSARRNEISNANEDRKHGP